MYEATATAAELAVWGLLPSDIAAVELWQENIPAYELFEFMSTQWRTGAVGATGLDYNVATHHLDRQQLDPDEYDDLLFCLRVMEAAALVVMADQKDK